MTTKNIIFMLLSLCFFLFFLRGKKLVFVFIVGENLWMWLFQLVLYLALLFRKIISTNIPPPFCIRKDVSQTLSRNLNEYLWKLSKLFKNCRTFFLSSNIHHLASYVRHKKRKYNGKHLNKVIWTGKKFQLIISC